MFTKPFSHISKIDAAIAGGKGASLGEMTQADVPVPPGFVALSNAFEHFLEETDLNVEIDTILHTVKTDEMRSVEHASEKIQKLIFEARMPADIGAEIRESFISLDVGYVAVRSSATAEDSDSAAWAGQLDTFLNTTEKNLLENVQKCWASLFTPRAIFYRFEKGLHAQKISVAVVVQKMIQSEISGIAFSVHPVTEDRNQLIIEAGYGLGEAIVSGSITPDSYVVEKEPRKIIDTNIVHQERGIFQKAGGGNEWQSIEEARGSTQKLSNEQILELAALIIKIENHYGFPCDIEWAYAGGKFYITQSRPITTLNDVSFTPKKNEKLILGNQEVDASLLNVEMTWAGMRDNFIVEQLGKPMPVFSFEMIKGKTLNGYLNPTELKEFSLLCSRVLTDKLSLLAFLKKETVRTSKKIRDYALAHKPKNKLNTLSNHELAALLLEIRAKQATCATYGTIVAFADIFGGVTQPCIDVLAGRKLQYPQHVYSKVLMPPEEKSLTEKATEDIVNSEDSADDLCDKYFWLNQGYIGRGLSKEEISYIKRDKDDEMLPSRDNLLNELRFSNQEENLFNVVRDIVYIKSLRADSRQYLHVVANRIVDILAERLKIEARYLEALTAVEISDFITNSQGIPETLFERYNHSIITPIGRDTYSVLFGEEANEFISTKISSENLKNVTEIKGKTAYPGKIKGKVKLVFGPQHIGKVQSGDIMVSTVTSPQLLPAMKKASAFITDIGGITSHAAIVSRELKKPCIIGTKIATQVLRDGDVVEVDADEGVVRIVESAVERGVSVLSPALQKKYPIKGLQLSEFTFTHPKSVQDASFEKEVAFSLEKKLKRMFIRRRTILFIESCRYAATAAWERWGIRFAFMDYGETMVKGVFQTENLNTDAASLWWNNIKQEENFVDKLLREFEGIIAIDVAIMEHPILKKKSWSDDELVEILNIYMSWFSQFFEIVYPWFAIDEMKEKHLEPFLKTYYQKNSTELIQKLLRPTKLPFSSLEQEALIKVAERDGRIFESALIEHARRYASIALRDIDDQPHDLAYFRSRVESLKADGIENAKEGFARLKQEIGEADKLETSLDAPREIRQLVHLTRSFVFLRTHSIDYMNMVLLAFQPVFKAIAGKLAVDLEELMYLTLDEMVSGIRGVPLKAKATARERMQKPYLYIISPGGSYLSVGEESATAFAQVMPAANSVLERVTSLKGVPAFPGKVRGRARVILDRKRSNELQTGEILVTPMTIPDFVPAMQRSAGIITNEGGVLCHAAIMSRELKKPCIIGTKIATDVLHDGDLVEVDADEGVVRIVERAAPN